MSLVTVQKITDTDLPELARLFVEVFSAAPWDQPWTQESALERLSIIRQSYGFYGLQLVQNYKPIAGVLARLGSFLGELELEIVEMFVSNAHQRIGLGGDLLDALKQQASRDKIHCFVLQTGADTFAKDFYLKHGFKAHEDNLLMSLDY